MSGDAADTAPAALRRDAAGTPLPCDAAETALPCDAAGTAPAALRRELQPGERLLWHGRPDALGLAWSRLPLLLLLPFGLGVTGLVMQGADTVGRFGQAGGVLAALAGGGLLALGLLLLGVAPLALLQARWVAYGVTDRRALIVDRTPLLGRVRSVPPAAIGGVERRPFAFGRGDLHFLREAPRRRRVGQGFLAIADAGQAEAAILRLAARPSWSGAAP